MPFLPVLHAELLKIRTVRSHLVALCAVLPVTVGFSVLAARGDGSSAEDPLFSAFFGVTFGQIAVVAFATAVVSAEFRDGALRVTLAAVPCRVRWFAAKALAVALPVLLVGLVTGVACGCAAAHPLSAGEQVRGAVGCGVYLTLMALAAVGVAAVLRSGVATLGLLIPLLLSVSFVIGDMSGTLADALPDRAGQVVLHSGSDGAFGMWSGLAVTAAWAAAALLAGTGRVRGCDA
ncbi:ABC transporter permease [Streptomyces mangrovisoli]|uniref:ABC transporter permease n=1 Tax=Streptomyces mangrovisoli TaxID=1428628 RepID=A0A1J4P0B0_9ACTN|nr:ABC transporter permease [Streptomyces mangrovisoli]OIJ66901.1 ABC transporter permease [Streptomyces mangrovisoli]